MRAAAWLGGVVVFGLVVAGGVAQDKAGASDKDKLQGTWTVASAKNGGKDMPEDKIKGIKFTVAGDKMTMFHDKETQDWTFKVDSTKNPKEIDVTFPDGKTGKGIYELKGDTWKVAHGEAGDARPTDFVSKEGSKVAVMVFQREKPKK